MRVVTFYSYKGGVGRTLALLNVAASLVARGNRVLIVDFDLEAPGIDKANGLEFEPTRGMVELISDYLSDAQVPRVQDYVAPATFRDPSNRMSSARCADRSRPIAEAPLLVLPAGLRSDEEKYRQRLSKIDFRKLYSERQGFLFFEDVREQFSKALARDYVLIDSRTGHTDVGQVCTQQLPDHVVGVMVPNEQNLAGMASTISQIRERHAMCDIDLVLSRIPRIDDLQGQIREFEQRVREETEIRRVLQVHAAESLALLQDDIYCADEYFSRSQLTEDYQRIAKTILVRNIDSRDAVLFALRGGITRVRAAVGSDGASKWVEAVLGKHANDEEVLEALSDVLRRREYERQRAAVAARLDYVTRSSAAAVAARDAIDADASGGADRARKGAIEALSMRGDLGCKLVAACFALLCRDAPDDADRIARDRKAPTVASMMQLADIATYQHELLSTRGGAEVVHAAIGARMRFKRPKPGEFVSKGQRSSLRVELDPRIAKPYAIATGALGLSTSGSGYWMTRYAGGHDNLEAPSWERFIAGWDEEHLDGHVPGPDDFSFWMRFGVEEEASLSEKANAAIMHALCGQLEPARTLIQEIDHHFKDRSISPSESVLNGWRILYTSVQDLRDDLQDLVRLREPFVGANGGASPANLPRLVLPLGLRRGQEKR